MQWLKDDRDKPNIQ